MRAPRDILKHVSVERAERKRKCHRNSSHQVTRGELCVVISEGSFAGSKNYCVPCAREILEAARTKLAGLTTALSE